MGIRTKTPLSDRISMIKKYHEMAHKGLEDTIDTGETVLGTLKKIRDASNKIRGK